MKHPIGKGILFFSSLFCLLMKNENSFALTTQDINNIITSCSANRCATWCGDIIPGFFLCYCVDCRSQTGTALSQVGGISDLPTVSAETVYQMDDEQYLCKDKAEESRLLCVPLKLQVKVLDTQNLPTEGKDRDAADEILRMKTMIATPKTDVVAPVEIRQPVKQPTKPATPFFRRSMPVVR